MRTPSSMRIVATAVAIACATAATAQQPDTPTFAGPAVDGPSCADLSWQKEIVARYPNIAAACQEVVVANAVRYARFTGELVRVNRDGSVKFDFKDRDGKSLGKATTLEPAASQRALIEGRSYRFSELSPGQELSVYVPEAQLVVATEPGAPPDAVAKMVFDDPPATAEAEPNEAVRLAEAPPAAAGVQPDRLPDTAGWTPMLVLFGVLALVGGLLLATRRRLRDSDALVETDTDADEPNARRRREHLASELKELWNKPTTLESLRPPLPRVRSRTPGSDVGVS